MSASLTTLNPLTVWITTNCGKLLKRQEYKNTLCLLRNLYSGQGAIVRTVYGTTGSKLGKEYVKNGYSHPVCMQSTSCKMLDWMKHILESRLPGEISITSDMQMTLT